MRIRTVGRALQNRFPRLLYRDQADTPDGRRIAVCYHGPPRSLRSVVDSHARHVFEPLRRAGLEPAVFVHTWSSSGPQRIREQPVSAAADYAAYDLLAPQRLQRDDQDEFLATLDFSRYFRQDVWDRYGDEPVVGEWRPALVQNYVCSLESQKRVTALVSGDFRYVMYVRPDVEFANDVDCARIRRLKRNQIILPRFDSHEGFNDRFSVMTLPTAKLYGSRIDWLPSFRARRGRIVSEKVTRHFILANGLRPIFIDVRFSIVRPESTGGAPS
jgi:hypothetical protein